MKTLLIIILLTLSMSIFAKDKIGYLVAVTGTEKIKIYKCQSIDKAVELFNIYFPGNCMSLEKVLKYSNYFQVLTENRGYYVEAKRMIRRRHLLFGKRTGKIVFRKLRK